VTGPARARAGIPRFVLVWLIADLLIGFLHVINLTVIAAFREPLAFFDMDYEANLPTWYSALQLGMLALLLAILAWVHIPRRDRGSWALALPVLMASYLSLDEHAQIHERLRPIAHIELLPFSGGWMLVAVPLFLLSVALTVWVTRPFWGPPPIRRLGLMAVALYAFAAGVLEIPHNFMEPNSLAHLTINFFEELGEMLAATMAIWAVYRLLARNGVRIVLPRERPPLANHQLAQGVTPSRGD
jgi:hypothetical protein